MKITQIQRRLLSWLLAVSLVLGYVPIPSLAAQMDNSCDHHPVHTAECHYAEGSAGSACTHAHSEDCYKIVECLHTCGEDCEDPCTHECTVENGCITMERDCHHTHGDCGYSEGTAEVPCGHVHDETCGYVAPVEGVACGHTEHTDCGYAPATEGTPCTHGCEVKVGSADSCYKLLCSHKDGGHDDACGYVPAAEAHECHYECAECAAALTAEGKTNPATESTTEPSTEVTEPEVVCTCESDDPEWHAPFCGLYVASENPECFCAEKCTEGNTNEWCEVCYFDPTACGASGQEKAAATNINVTIDTGESVTLKDTDGDGYYELRTADDLYAFAALTDAQNHKNVELANNIIVNDVTFTYADGTLTVTDREGNAVDVSTLRTWTPIGLDQSSKTAYIKTINGNGFYISGLYCDRKKEDFVGFFGMTGSTGGNAACIENLGIVNSFFQGNVNTGTFSGYASSGATIRNCYSDAIVLTGNYGGGFVGFANNTNNLTITNSLYFGVLENQHTGGVFTSEYNCKQSIINCYYLEGCAKYVKNDVTAVTADQLASGEVAYLLGEGFGQDITTGEGDDIVDRYPVPASRNLVYRYTSCDAPTQYKYTNDSALSEKTSVHFYTNGICTVCDAYEPAALNESGYYEISNGGQLFWFANYINTVDRTASAVLMKDINLEGRPWTPIGATGEGSNNFRGHFDGQNHTIKGLSVEGGRAGLGFFGEVRLGTVENFTIYGEVTLIGKYDYVGGVIGSAPGANSDKPDHNGATIRNITSYVNVTLGEGSHGSNRVGGFMGYANHETLIENCTWYGTLDLGPYRAQDGVGGLVGKANDNSAVTIRNCAAYGTIKTSYQSGSYNSFDTIYIGGIVSNSVASAKTNIENTVWAGRIINETNLGAKAHISAVGTLNGIGSITNCYVLENSTPYVTTNGAHDSYITVVSEAQLASGEVAYKLGAPWGQNIGIDTYPILGGKKVYCGYLCSGEKGYSNSAEVGETSIEHSYENGICEICSSYEPAVYIEEKGYYEISNAGQLYWFAQEVNNGRTNTNAILMDDITINAQVLDADGDLIGNTSALRQWTPIGRYNSDSDNLGFAGTFDGNGKAISGLYHYGDSARYAGLFGYSAGTIRDLTIEDSYIHTTHSDGRAGAVTGLNEGTVSDCHNSGFVSGNGQIGGIVGRMIAGKIENCSNSGTVTGNKYIGGISGYIGDGAIQDCSNSGTVTGDQYIGGVSGYEAGGAIQDCSNSGKITANDQTAGGIAGRMNAGKIEKCSNSGAVTGNKTIGGICGYEAGGAIQNCSNYGTVTGDECIGGICGSIRDGSIQDCSNSGRITANTQYAGGIAGYVSNSTINKCSNSGRITANTQYAGGITGIVSDGTISNCYNTGSVKSNKRVGGISGCLQTTSNVSNCFNISTVEGETSVGGVVGHVLNNNTTKVKIANCYHDKTVYSGSAVGQNGGSSGKATLTSVEGKTTKQFTSGEVAYLLNGGVTDGTQVWYQTLGTDAHPKFSGLTVCYDKNANPPYYNTILDVVSVNISWGAMEFTYTDGDWQPESHTYADGSWTADNGSNWITVENNGTVAAKVTFAYEKATGMEAINGSFTIDGTNKITEVALPVNEEKMIYLLLTGKPNETNGYVTLGTITVTITAGGE